MGRLDRVIEEVDRLHAQDPTVVDLDGEPTPAELLYAYRMTHWLARLEPDASDALRIAVRCQHLQRWTLVRSQFPAGRAGYRQWRTESARRHAVLARQCTLRGGYEQHVADRVARLVCKQELSSDAEAQTLEDVACLVFLEHYAADFAAKHPEEKVRTIVRKTRNKMSARAAAIAVEIGLLAAS